MMHKKSLATKIIVSVGLIAIVLFATLAAAAALMPDAQQTIATLLKSTGNITTETAQMMATLKAVQGIQTVGIFLLPAIIMLGVFYGRFGITISLTTRVHIADLINVVFLIIASNTILFVVAQYCEQIPWPTSWVESNELNQKLTELLLTGDSYKTLFINLFIVAVLPAVAEEYFFRGFLQRISMKWIRDPHLSIFIVAVIFSAIHFDPVMFLPRFLLGAMFGYLYYWTCSLWLPIFAHFLNNGQYVLTSFFVEKNTADAAKDAADFTISNFYLIIFILLTGMILFSIYFRNMNTKPIGAYNSSNSN